VLCTINSASKAPQFFHFFINYFIGSDELIIFPSSAKIPARWANACRAEVRLCGTKVYHVPRGGFFDILMREKGGGKLCWKRHPRPPSNRLERCFNHFPSKPFKGIQSNSKRFKGFGEKIISPKAGQADPLN
jgi:hypothetical protein